MSRAEARAWAEQKQVQVIDRYRLLLQAYNPEEQATIQRLLNDLLGRS